MIGVVKHKWFTLLRRRRVSRPGWELVCVSALVVVMALGYGIALDRSPLLDYYAAATRAMSENLKSFIFASLDPSGNLALDKLPGSFWVDAISVRVFGFHNWSVLLPHVLEAVLVVVVFNRVVRRWWGPVTGYLAAVFLSLTPIVGALVRANVGDMLLLLLLLLAVAAWQRAIEGESLRWLIASGVWIGLAFHVKMVQAWVVLPVLGITYLMAGDRHGPALNRKIRQLSVALAIALAVSSLWIALVLFTPESSRPHLDGAVDNSPISMVFEYNAFNRLGIGDELGVGFGSSNRWLYILGRDVVSQVGWLYPMALAGLIFSIFLRAEPSGSNPLAQVGNRMWGLWFAMHALLFSVGYVAHTFYVVLLAPAVACLAAGALVTSWSMYQRRGRQQWWLPAVLAITTAWSCFVILGYRGFLPWLTPTVLTGGSLAVLVLVVRKIRMPRWRGRSRLIAGAVVLGLVAILLAPTAWSATTIHPMPSSAVINPIAGPGRWSSAALPSRSADAQPWVEYLHRHRRGERYLFAINSAQLAAPYLVAGEPVLPMNGLSGRIPAPTPEHVAALVARGDLRFLVFRDIGWRGKQPDTAVFRWAARYCGFVDPVDYGGPVGRQEAAGIGSNVGGGPMIYSYTLSIYDCERRPS